MERQELERQRRRQRDRQTKRQTDRVPHSFVPYSINVRLSNIN